MNETAAPSRQEDEEALLPHYLIELDGELYALPRSTDINLS